MQSSKRIIRQSAAPLLWVIFYVDSAFACSLVNAAASTAESITTSDYYWIASGLLGGLVIFIELYQRRWLSIISSITVVILFFHPRWTVAPIYGPDCTFQNVEASQFVLAAICLLLGYQIFRMVRFRRGNS
jgi:hypothetical protein